MRFNVDLATRAEERGVVEDRTAELSGLLAVDVDAVAEPEGDRSASENVAVDHVPNLSGEAQE